MTLALVGSMAFVGFAGMAAAGGGHHDDKADDSGDDSLAASSVSQSQTVSQTNVIEQNASQFASQDATGVDIDLEDVMDDGDDGTDGDDGENGVDDGEDTQTGIQTVTFIREEGNQPYATFEWDGDDDEFDLESSMGQGDNIDLTPGEARASDGNPLDATWTFDPPGASEAQTPVRALVTNSDGTTCTFEYGDAQLEGSVEACEPDNGGNGGNGDNGGDNGDNGDVTDGIEGSVGNQTVNQLVEQNADASNSNTQSASANAFSGDLAAMISG
ncbi:hypothetical protein KWG76_03970 [Haloterrigena longa]|uniref:Uncharacterized protein n=2 Tax=Natrinema longum TaxID=370324 RepID=A0A8A2UER0_9EURY|nr:hypothetical protein [Natrinema longum]QSW87010.1 hypothetical protein J0X27_14195 [Natrinema longum]